MESLRSIILKLTVRHKSSRRAEFIPSTFVIHYSIFSFHTFPTSHLPSFPASPFALCIMLSPHYSLLSPEGCLPFDILFFRLPHSDFRIPSFPPSCPRLPPSHFRILINLPTFSPSHRPTFPSSHRPTFSPSHLLTFPPSHLLTFSSSSPRPSAFRLPNSSASVICRPFSASHASHPQLRIKGY